MAYPTRFLEDVENSTEFRNNLNKIQSHFENIRNNNEGNYPNVIFLGTSASPYGFERNVSSILLNIR